VCLKCAERMDRDRHFKAPRRPAFEEFQRDMSELLEARGR
jgi:hypothetical protein